MIIGLTLLLFLLLQKTYPEVPSDNYAQLRVYNGVPDCTYNFVTNLPHNGTFTLRGLEHFEQIHLRLPNASFHFVYTILNANLDCPELPSGTYEFEHHTAYGLFLQPEQTDAPLYWYVDQVEKSVIALPIVRTLANLSPERTIVWRQVRYNVEDLRMNASCHELAELQPTEYDVFVDNVKVHQEHLHHGGVYALIIGGNNDDELHTHMVIVTAPNSISMLWLIPQYTVLTLAEVMFAVTGLEFSYAQAPESMKTVIQACYMLTVAFGNMIVIFVAELKAFDSQAMEFFLFAGIMFFDMLIFMWLANQYQSNDIVQNGKHALRETTRYVHPKYTKKTED